MNVLVASSRTTLPLPLAAAGEHVARRYLEFFAANIRNSNTRRAYGRAAMDFMAWCGERGVQSLPEIQPLHVAAGVEELGRTHSIPTVKQRLAAIRHLFDWMVVGQAMPTNPAHRPRPEILGPARQDAGTGARASPAAARQHPNGYAGGLAGPRADRADDLFVRADRRGAGDGGP